MKNQADNHGLFVIAGIFLVATIMRKSYKRGVSEAIFSESLQIGEGEKWYNLILGDFCSVIMGQSPDSSTYNTDGTGLPLVQGNADIKDGVATPQRYTSSPTKIAPAGSILLSVRAPVGSVSMTYQEICLGRGVCAIAAQNNDFLYHLLVFVQDEWKRIEQGGTFTAISGDDIRQFKVNVPTEEEQKIIGRYLNNIDALISQNQNICDALIKLKNALLQSLFI